MWWFQSNCNCLLNYFLLQMFPSKVNTLLENSYVSERSSASSGDCYQWQWKVFLHMYTYTYFEKLLNYFFFLNELTNLWFWCLLYWTWCLESGTQHSLKCVRILASWIRDISQTDICLNDLVSWILDTTLIEMFKNFVVLNQGYITQWNMYKWLGVLNWEHIRHLYMFKP